MASATDRERRSALVSKAICGFLRRVCVELRPVPALSDTRYRVDVVPFYELDALVADIEDVFERLPPKCAVTEEEAEDLNLRRIILATVRRATDEAEGNGVVAARRLGISRSKLYRYLHVLDNGGPMETFLPRIAVVFACFIFAGCALSTDLRAKGGDLLGLELPSVGAGVGAEVGSLSTSGAATVGGPEWLKAEGALSASCPGVTGRLGTACVDGENRPIAEWCCE